MSNKGGWIMVVIDIGSYSLYGQEAWGNLLISLIIVNTHSMNANMFPPPSGQMIFPLTFKGT
jgi:hypothetical protein